MSRPAAKGWCPGTHRPMMSGDGLIVRVRPRLGRLVAQQVLALCAAAQRHGSGVIELTSRANVQIRGVAPDRHGALLADLLDAKLLDEDPTTEARQNLLVTPLWQPGDDTEAVAAELVARLPELPELPVKFGFAIDAGAAPALADASADVRLERTAAGDLMVRLDGRALGRPVRATAAVDALVQAAHWFALRSGAARRVRDLQGDPPPAWQVAAPAPASRLEPGSTPLGPMVGVPFGQLDAAGLAASMRQSQAVALRLAPGRLLLLEGAKRPAGEGFVTGRGDPLLSVRACPGAPACASATVATRALARALAPWVPDLHVSGCAKGCAHARPASLTLVGRDGAFDLVRDGAAWDTPSRRGLTSAQILAEVGEP